MAEAEKLLELLTLELEIDEEGTCRYRLNGLLHRQWGPAITWHTGELEYWQDGQPHRLDGPAVIHRDYLGWFIQGREYTAAEFIEQQRNAGILLPALKDSYWFSQIPDR